jgi:hypothetical protein
MLEPGPLLAILEQASRGHDEECVEADHAEQRREDVVDEDVGETGDGRGATPHQGRGRGAGAGGIGHEGGRGGVKVTAAVELFFTSLVTDGWEDLWVRGKWRETNLDLHQALDAVRLLHEPGEEVVAGLEGQDPEVQAQDEGVDHADDTHPPGGLEPAAGGGGETRQRDEEGNEDEDGVDDARGQGEPLVQQVARGLPAVGGHFILDVGDNDAEGQDEDAHQQEEEVGDEVGDLDLVCRHGGGVVVVVAAVMMLLGRFLRRQ